MISFISRKFVYIPISVLNKALKDSKITNEEVNLVYKENLVEYYNDKLLYHLKYQQWDDFFYLYNTSKIFDHGTNAATHIIAAHGYIMAYQNLEKANEIIAKLPEDPGVVLTKNILKCYEELDKLGIAPVSVDWVVVVSMCAAASLGKKSQNKWEKLSENPRTPWHYSLRPWKYPRSEADIRDDYRFKQRGDR